MTQQPQTANLPRGLTMIGFVFTAIGLIGLSVLILEWRDAIRVYPVELVTKDDFAGDEQQAQLTGQLQIGATQVEVPPATKTGVALVGGTSATVFVPLTPAGWQKGDPVALFVVSPVITGITQQTYRPAVNSYLSELRAYQPPMQVSLIPNELSARMRALDPPLAGVSDETLFVWPDHVQAMKITTQGGEFEPFMAFIPLVIGLGLLIAGTILRRRQKVHF